MNIIYATYNILHNSIDVSTHAGYFLRIDCNKAEEGLITTPCSECALITIIDLFSIRHMQNVLSSILSPILYNHHMIFPSLPLNV